MKIMMKNLKWKPVQLTGSILSKGVDDLIGIEELTEYDASTVKKTDSKKRKNQNKNTIKQKKTAKSKLAKVEILNDSTEAAPHEINDRKGKKALKRNIKTCTDDPNRIAKKMNLKWKPVQLTESILSKGVDDLIGIEELTEYDASTVKKTDSKKRKNPKKNMIKQKKTAKSKVAKVEILNDSTEAAPHEINDRKGKKALKRNIKTCTDDPNRIAKKIKYENGDTHVDCSNTSDISFPIMEGMEAWYGLGVPNCILKALSEKGFKKPTEIQALALPPAIFGRRDILGAAETGSGKTLAFGIPILYGIMQNMKKDNVKEKIQGRHSLDNTKDSSTEEELICEDENQLGCVKVIDKVNLESSCMKATQQKLYALILTPTRELAIQVRNHLVTASKYTGIKTAVVVGGMSSQKQERLLKKCPEIVVATPGRLWELIQEGNPHLSQVDKIKFLAIDETDRMVERGHFQELQTLLERLNVDENLRKRRQNFVFSATLTLVHEIPQHLSQKKRKRITPGQKLQSVISMIGITNPKVIDITRTTGTVKSLTEARIYCTLEEKDQYLYYFCQRHPGRTLVFCNSINCVRRLTQLMGLLKCQPLPLHASMAQRQRLKNLERFSNNPNSLLLATDVAARGLDIPDVQHVIHYQVPRTSESYVHRSGRTARAENEGLTILLIEPSEIAFYSRLCRNLGRDKDIPDFPVDDALFSTVKQRVQLARELDKLELASRRNSVQTNWFQKALKDMDMICDGSDLPKTLSQEASHEVKKAALVKRKQLAALLEKPVLPKGFSGKYPTQTGKLELPFSKGTNKSSAVQLLNESNLDNKKRTKKKSGAFVRVSKELKNVNNEVM